MECFTNITVMGPCGAHHVILVKRYVSKSGSTFSTYVWVDMMWVRGGYEVDTTWIRSGKGGYRVENVMFQEYYVD